MRSERMQNTHPQDVIAALRKGGSSLSKLARANKLDHSALGHCLRRCIPRANRVIAKQLGKSVCELWPLWFDSEGNRLSQRRDPSHKGGPRKRQMLPRNADTRRAA